MQRVSPRALLLSAAAIGALVASLLVVFMLMGSSGTPNAQAIVPTKTPTGPAYKVVANVIGTPVFKAGDQSVVVLNISKKPNQETSINDQLLWKGLRWTVVGGSQPNNPYGKGTVTPVVPGDLQMEAEPCPGQNPADYPQDQTTIYEPKPCGGGTLGGLFDVDAGPGLYHCIVRTDEDIPKPGSTLDMVDVKTAAQCYAEFAAGVGAGEPPCSAIHSTGGGPTPVVSGEGNCGGHVDPPPYSPLAPTKLTGFYCPLGGPACNSPKFPAPWSPVAPDTLITVGCFADIGGSLGPNAVAVISIPNASATNPPIDGLASGTLTLFIGATNAVCDSAENGVAPSSSGDEDFPFSLIRRALSRDFDGDGCTDMDELFADKVGSSAKCGDDPWNPYDPTGGSPVDVSGSYDLTAEAARADVGAPGLYYDCKAEIQQAVKNLTARVLCYIDSPAITVNPQVASGNPAIGVNSCPPANAKFCGDGLPGAAPPGCDDTANPCATLAGQGAGCPTLPCDVSQYQFADVFTKVAVLTGTIDNTTNNMELTGCFNNPFSPIGFVLVQAMVNIHTGLGVGLVYINQTDPNCKNGIPTGGGVKVQIAMVRQAPGNKAGGCTPNTGVGYTGCRDSDGDGCPDSRELADTKSTGGLRDPSNRWDYFNPEKVGTPHSQGGADISYVVTHYNKNQGNSAYTIDSDRTGILGANSWNAGPPDGKVSGQDITVAVNQYNQNC